MSALVSVVMSVHDAGKYLAPTMDSVLSQEDVDLELLVIDDGSQDGSGEILRGYARRDSRVRLLRQANLGLTEALIRGCSAARGEYIARQDAADLSAPGRLSRQRRALDSDPELALVSCWTEYRGPEMEYLYTTRDNGRARRPADVVVEENGRPTLADGPTHHGSVMFRKEHYERAGGYRKEFFLAQDRDLWFRLAEVGRFQTLPEVLYVALVLPASRSSSFRTMQHELGRLARRAFELRRDGLSEEVVLKHASELRPRTSALGSRRVAGTHYFIGEALRRNGDRRCLRYLSRAVRLDPLRAAGWVRLLQAGATSTLRRWRPEVK